MKSERKFARASSVHPALGEAHNAPADTIIRQAMVQLDYPSIEGNPTNPKDVALSRTILAIAQWQIVARFSRDGCQYLVACEQCPMQPSIQILTPREREVAMEAQLGKQNKVIAYELGIAVSTVSVLLSRAAKKFGVRGRRELVVVLSKGNA
jgi:DNA-binding CsgD family transcriptional regulator